MKHSHWLGWCEGGKKSTDIVQENEISNNRNKNTE
jgi:hypothetical protein